MQWHDLITQYPIISPFTNKNESKYRFLPKNSKILKRLVVIRCMNAQSFKVSLLVLTLFSFLSCGSDRSLLFEVNNEIEFLLPGGLNTIETHVFVIRGVPTFYRSSLNSNGVAEGDVISISAAKARLIGSFGQIDYNFIDEISVRALSKSGQGINKEMYYQDRIPFNQQGDLELFSSISELKDILSEEIIDMEVRIRLRQSTAVQLQNKLIFSYAVFDM